MNLLALIGAPGSGKDVFSNCLSEKFGFSKIAFADKIKEEFFLESGLTNEVFKNSRGTELELTIRAGLWDFSVKKTQNDLFYFIDPVVNEIKRKNGNIIVTDVRTQLELVSLKREFNIKVIRIIRDINDLTKEIIPGTKIRNKSVEHFPIFYNCYDGLDLAYEQIQNFYVELKNK